jgi:Rubisco accumulation factor 1 alpha helical domain/Rubisco Assembly chaperone C-terminal domain/Rubisco accumulation factor 1 helix turn helix domain
MFHLEFSQPSRLGDVRNYRSPCMHPTSPDSPQTNPALSSEEARSLLLFLRRKEGNWVEWGKACQTLQKGGYSSATIFEETGFEPIQQNQVIVAAQVYDNLCDTSEAVRSYFLGPKSDVLYEFRVLNQVQRVAAAQLAMDKQLDVDGAHHITRAIKEFSRLYALPEGFSNHPGDAVAYQCWNQARSKKDLQDRSRLIAQGLKFAHSQTAREKIEQLLSDFTVVPTKRAPLLPMYRVEAEEELPRIVPVVGTLPLTRADLEAIPKLAVTGPFNAIQSPGAIAFAPIPGWRVLLNAIDPVAIQMTSDRLPNLTSERPQLVLVAIDREVRQWNGDRYFLVERNGELEIQWFDLEPDCELLGQVILVLRSKQVFDENALSEIWQIEE